MENDNSGYRQDPRPADAPPVPDAAFRWDHRPWGQALRCPALETIAQHLFTSRQPPFTGANPPSSDDRFVAPTRSLGLDASRVLRIRQVHGRTVRVVRRGESMEDARQARPEADAIVSNAAGAGLLVQVADCVPILMADAEAGAAAAVHAGWRGTCAGIAAAAVACLVHEFGCRPAQLVAAIGPSIGPDDYEVGDALLDRFKEAGHEAFLDRWFRRRPSGALHLDLWRANADQLEDVGVPARAVHQARLSTYRHPRWLESYRRDGAAAGRMAAVIVVPSVDGAHR